MAFLAQVKKYLIDVKAWAVDFPHGVVLLEDYISAFSISPRCISTRAFLKFYGAALFDRYKFFPAEIAIEQLNMIIRRRDHGRWLDMFQTAINSLDRQYLRLREARKAIYRCDSLKEYGCTIAVDENPPLCDEGVVWDIFEPELVPGGNRRVPGR